MANENPNQSDGEHFEEAIARYQLDLQTELKKTSSLPTAMFDASDEMIEARLCEATESILRCLVELRQPPDSDQHDDTMGIEVVSTRETVELLRAVRARSAEPGPQPRLDDGRTLEFTAVLADICQNSSSGAGERAASQLRDLVGCQLRERADLIDALAQHLMPGGPDQLLEAEHAATCARIAASMTRHLQTRDNSPEAGP